MRFRDYFAKSSNVQHPGSRGGHYYLDHEGNVHYGNAPGTHCDTCGMPFSTHDHGGPHLVDGQVKHLCGQCVMEVPEMHDNVQSLHSPNEKHTARSAPTDSSHGEGGNYNAIKPRTIPSRTALGGPAKTSVYHKNPHGKR